MSLGHMKCSGHYFAKLALSFMFLATIEREMELRAQIDTKKLEAEMLAKAKADRENQDLILERLRVQAAENRITVLESIKYVFYVI